MNKKQPSSIRKEIFLPSFIGDWTTYTSEKNQQSISITKSIGISNKTVSQQTINHLLFIHQEFFELFFEKVAQKINSHIELDRISINVLNHKLFKENLKSNIYQCKFNIPELEQIDLILSKKATKLIAHRLCGGNTAPDEITDPTDLEISLTTVLNNLFIEELSIKWNKIFPFIPNAHNTSYGHYQFHPQQSENETILEFNANLRLFNQYDLSCKILYSLETIEKILFFEELLNGNIVDNTRLTNTTLKNTKVNVTSIIGKTTLALNEIQNIEIGDVIFLENQKLNDPIQVLVDNNIVFNATPVKINERELGVQIINTPSYEQYKQESSKPTEGPFISSKKQPTNEIKDTDSITPSNVNTDANNSFESEVTTDQTDFNLETESFETESEEPTDITTTDNSNEENEGIEDADFSWDDLDDE